MITTKLKHQRNADLSPAKIRAIRKLYEKKLWKPVCIATAYNLPYTTVWDIIHYKSYRDVK